MTAPREVDGIRTEAVKKASWDLCQAIELYALAPPDDPTRTEKANALDTLRETLMAEVALAAHAEAWDAAAKLVWDAVLNSHWTISEPNHEWTAVNGVALHGKFLALAAKARGAAQQGAATCQVPPPGWYCTRAAGHEGPCAAREVGAP